LALASLIIADCNLRQVPVNLDGLDALESGKAEDKLKNAAEQLDAFLTGPLHAQAGDALLKLGLTCQRLAAMQAQPKEKAKWLDIARKSYARLLGKEFPTNNPFAAQAKLETAKCMVMANDKKGATRLLQTFSTDP